MPPEGSPLNRVARVLVAAFRNRRLPPPASDADLFDPPPGTGGAVGGDHTGGASAVGGGSGVLRFRMARTDRLRCLDKAALIGSAPGGGANGAKARAAAASVTEVEETKALLGLGPIFLCVCLWQMCYDPIFTLLPLPGDAMDRTVGAAGGGRFKIPASSVSFANTVGVLASVAAYDLVVAPLAARLGRPISITARIGWGYVVAIAALLSGAPSAAAACCRRRWCRGGGGCRAALGGWANADQTYSNPHNHTVLYRCLTKPTDQKPVRNDSKNDTKQQQQQHNQHSRPHRGRAVPRDRRRRAARQVGGGARGRPEGELHGPRVHAADERVVADGALWAGARFGGAVLPPPGACRALWAAFFGACARLPLLPPPSLHPHPLNYNNTPPPTCPPPSSTPPTLQTKHKRTPTPTRRQNRLPKKIPYFLLGASETLTNVGVMELFFNEVSEGTRALGASVNLLTTAVGTYLAGAPRARAAEKAALWRRRYN